MAKIKLFFMVLIEIIFLSLFANASTLISDSGVKYDSSLPSIFEDINFANNLISQPNFIGLKIIDNEVWAKVSISIKDTSGIILVGTKEEKRELVNQQIEWANKEVQNILFNLSSEDIKEINQVSGGLFSLISKKGFNKLINNDRIDQISWNQYKPELTTNNENIFFEQPFLFIFLTSILIFLIITIYLVKFRKKKKK